MSITARLATTAVAGLAGFGVVGIYTMIAGPAVGILETALVMVLFTAVYVPAVFAARRLLQVQAAEALAGLRTATR